ncbi:hypothetical protein JAAARDRAFT_54397 [Jaapia argillacea MUCL 33604]|uniref:ABM domain-containing protein n=1 Tax=Jaapia argillacea MUCL 33604 TaxID=933084 RepID=A0A067QG33_9AGAM|nr:hypothetical protein JAAARDRAFT_54397 [Jaapia argillacea MUCL 33604]
MNGDSHMNVPVVEFCMFPSTEEYQENPVKGLTGVFDILWNKAEGTQFVYHGVEKEDLETAYLLVGWKTLAHHLKLMSNTTYYDPLLASLESSMSTSLSNVEVIHIQFGFPPNKAFESPVTELSFITPKSEDEEERVKVTEMVKEMERMLTKAGIPCAWGPAVDKEGLVTLAVGWESVAKHWSTVKENHHMHDIVGTLLEAAEVVVKHVKLSPYVG